MKQFQRKNFYIQNVHNHFAEKTEQNICFLKFGRLENKVKSDKYCNDAKIIH